MPSCMVKILFAQIAHGYLMFGQVLADGRRLRNEKSRAQPNAAPPNVLAETTLPALPSPVQAG
jgi:hypothetical protein